MAGVLRRNPGNQGAATGSGDTVPQPNRQSGYEGPWSVVGGNLTLSIAAYGNRIFAGTTGSERGRQDLVIVNAETDTVVDIIRSADVYVHQMALDPTSGDIYVASVYPEHGGERRGPDGPSFVRWTR